MSDVGGDTLPCPRAAGVVTGKGWEGHPGAGGCVRGSGSHGSLQAGLELEPARDTEEKVSGGELLSMSFGACGFHEGENAFISMKLQVRRGGPDPCQVPQLARGPWWQW